MRRCGSFHQHCVAFFFLFFRDIIQADTVSQYAAFPSGRGSRAFDIIIYTITKWKKFFFPICRAEQFLSDKTSLCMAARGVVS